ncbi:MAG: Flp pilus assembly complex ATPase component TadA [Planctomycetes bacterium]|nr:Flp pilus assembly complex ATPase component TadA [Planctomycetota bacterium]
MTETGKTGPRKLLGEILRAANVVGEAQLQDALKYQAETGLKIGECLVRLGHCQSADVSRALARQAGMPFVDVKKGQISPEVIAAIPKEVAEEHNIVPVKLDGPGKVILAVTDPLAVYNLEHLKFILNLDFRCALTTEEAMVEALSKYYGLHKKDAATVGDAARRAGGAAKEVSADDAPIIRLVQNLFDDAVRARASDIHVEPFADRVRVRFRVDGVCRVADDFPTAVQGAVLSRLKIMAEMDIAEKRKPQDGRLNIHAHGKELDVRVSALPGTHGESIVMRLLDKQEGLVSLERLGFVGEDQRRFHRVIKRPNGIFLVTGPTGSGKTTTLYAALQELNRPDVKIITAENPVEYHLPGVNQCQVHHQIGLDFARILRSMLRQAPNIILVGEIRDQETASIAIQAALTGHLVFSTLHTNDAPAALTRLMDMGVAPFLVSSSVAAVMAQRLIRRLCNSCKEKHEPTATELDSIGLASEHIAGKTVYCSVGCDQCRMTGYSGRVGIFELLEMSPDLREAVFRSETTSRLREIAISSGGMLSLRVDGHRKIIEGVTSVDEILRVLSKELVLNG